MSTVIKAGQRHGKLLRRLETIDLADHLAEAHKIVEGAKREAARLIAEAGVAATEIRREAEQRGHREGYQKGHKEGLAAGHDEGLRAATERFGAEQADLCRAFSAIIADMEGKKRDLLIAANHDLLTFAAAVAAKVTKRAAVLDAAAAAANLEAVLRLVGTRTDLVVRVNPRDAQTLRRFAEQAAGALSKAAHVTLVEDHAVAPGGCIVTTDETEVDATIETQVDQIVSLVLARPSTTGEADV